MQKTIKSLFIALFIILPPLNTLGVWQGDIHLYTKEQYIHIYSLEGTVLAAGSVETSLLRFIPRRNPDAMRSVCYVKANFLPQCELSQVLSFENEHGGHSGHFPLQRMLIQNPSASSSNHRETDLLRQSCAACTV